ncbi:MAG: adenylate/guanylate cyclase domain-containing protein [Candidatus Xenobia bacterium]
MSELVTMVFTDLVNSTAVKKQMPGRDVAERNVRFWEDILKPHRERVEGSLAEAGGRVVSTQGDGYFLVFRQLLAAVHWAVALQRDHVQRPIETPLGPQMVKIALHVGSPLLDGDNFIGHEVDYAARLASLCSGGQILVSDAAAALLRTFELRELRLHPHGERTLKGVGAVPVFEVLYDGRSPLALRQESAPRVELPDLPASFVGREALLAEVQAALRRGGIVVLRGEGGIGKTTLALVVAHLWQESSPVAWVECEPEPTLEDCKQEVAGARLIVMDNLESVARDAEIIRWLNTVRTPVLVTTREVPAGLRGHVIVVQQLTRAEAVKLFCDRLSMSGGRPPEETRQIEELCAAVGDAPLAVELLAGRAARIPLSRLQERLRQSLAVVDAVGDPNRPARHQSAASCFQVSYETLSAAAQQLLTHMALWADGISLEVLHTSMEGDTEWDDAAEALVLASLWRLEDDRYYVHPLVRQFALEQLGASRDAVLLKAVEAMARVAQAKAQRLSATAGPAAAEATAWFEEEWNNLLTAVDTAHALQAGDGLRSLVQSMAASGAYPRDLEAIMEKLEQIQ